MVLCHAAGTVPAHGESLNAALDLLPSRLSGLIARCLNHDPAARPTPTDVLEELGVPHTSDDDWLPPPLRTLVDLHMRPAG